MIKIKSKKEITKELRKINQDKLNKENQEGRICHICGTDCDVQNHHIIKVEQLSKMAYYHKVDDLQDMYIPTVDLCDYHHKVWHGCTGDTNYIDEDIDIDEFYSIVDILGTVDLSLAPEELYDDYKTHYDEMVNAFLFELRERYAFTEDEIQEIEHILIASQDLSVGNVSSMIDPDELDDEEILE
ncbi:MAG: hypothetical protein MJ245_05610 [Clostridia bacterium]|nr:hypothetical protein [Clostridia bacterium]